MTTAPLTPAAPREAPSPAPARPAKVKSQIASPSRIAFAIAHLAALGVIGSALFGFLFSLLGLGLGFLLVIGIGLLFLVGLVYVLFALGWLETARIDGLYHFGLTPRRLRRSGRPGFGGWIRSLGQQTIDPGMWRAIANLAVATLLGGITLFLFQAISSGIVFTFSPLFADDGVLRLFGTGFVVASGWAVVAGILVVVLAAAGIVGLAILHGVLARAIMVPSREAQLAEEARTSNAQRVGAVRAADVERTRIERDLHDGVQPRLVSVGMTLGLAQQKLDTDPAAAKELIAEAHTSTKAAITELRQLARGIHTSVLDDRGLDAALSALAARSVVPVQLDVRMDGRCSRDAEAAAYFAIAEALTNAAKHARASECRVVVRLRDEPQTGSRTLWARVEDNGVGGAQVIAGGGIDGIINRVLAAGGTARLDSPIGGPTSVEVNIPCAS
ncbi:histidine kinase [Microbacterium sp. CCNWLW134]|uniref:sensor histidine kinase n=1 Tax=Microbacterium sp. CCNWLW134 TaxID=3122064 RepID=UPI0030105446